MIKTFQTIPAIKDYPLDITAALVGECYLKTNNRIPLQKHQLCELHYVKKGSIDVRINRKLYHVKEGFFYFIQLGDAHSQIVKSATEMYFFSLYVSRTPREGVFRRSEKRSGFKKEQIRNIMDITRAPSCVIKAEKSAAECFEYLFKALRLNYEEKKTNSIFRDLILRISAQIYDYRVSMDIDKADLSYLPKNKMNSIRYCVDYLNKNYGRRPDIGAISRETGINKRQLQRVFRSSLGYSPTEYTMKVRIREALELLKDPDTKIDGVISRLGFNNRGRFYRYFTELTGISPAMYRESNSKDKQSVIDLFKSN